MSHTVHAAAPILIAGSINARVFRVIALNPGISMQEVAALMSGLSKTQIALAMRRLSKAGYIAKGGHYSWSAISDPSGITGGQLPSPRTGGQHGAYAPCDWRQATPLRPGALNHEQWPSRRGDKRLPFTGMVIAMTTRGETE